MTTRTTIRQSEWPLCFSTQRGKKLNAGLAVQECCSFFSAEGAASEGRVEPEFRAKVSEGKVEGVVGRRQGPPGGLDPHHPNGAIRLKVQGKVAADGLHAVAQLLAQDGVCESNTRDDHNHKHAALVFIYA